MALVDPILETFDALIAWVSSSVGMYSESYCSLETADDDHTLAAKDGSLVSVIKVYGATFLVGPDEFEKIHNALCQTFQASLSRAGHGLQVFFKYDKETVAHELEEILLPARNTAKNLHLKLDDLFSERVENLVGHCASETMYFVLWTRPNLLTKSQMDIANKKSIASKKEAKFPAIKNAQNIIAGMNELRDGHESYVRQVLADLNSIGLFSELLDVHEACNKIRKNIDPDFTDVKWKPSLPGDRIPLQRSKNFENDVSDIMWPPLSSQLIPRDSENLDLRTCRIGDRIYGTVFIELFPKQIQPFSVLYNRAMHAKIPWRISFSIESDGIRTLGLKPTLAAILSFASSNNKLISASNDLLQYLHDNTDDAIVTLQVAATTWAKVGNEEELRMRVAELAKSIQGWGYCETSEISGDAFAGTLSSSLALAANNVAKKSVAPLSDVVHMLPFNRPASPWKTGAVLFRSPDGKPWPYQPGSTLQTTWIDLVYARPGSGKSVLSNTMNLAICLSGGITRLPRIAIIDIGPSSSGLISLLKEALPLDKQYLVAYHRLRMIKSMSINPFDTQLGCRFPTAQERAFLVNFLTLLATPVGTSKPYDGITDMAGMVVDEVYKVLSDSEKPHPYQTNISTIVDNKVRELNIPLDSHSTWWEVTDKLFEHGATHEAQLAQRYAMPLLADVAAVCRTKTIEDLYGAIVAPTGEDLISSFGRMISSSVREYPILSQVTAFDLGDARVVSLDLDEVAKSGGEAADRQTAVMYMLARYVLARHYYLTEDVLRDMPDIYHEYHKERILEIREDQKRIVFDEFHRTSKAQAVRDQVLVDMREGRKWNVMVSLLSQSLDDFDDVMVEFATSVFIMDAGPKQAIQRSCDVFGLSDTARLALETRVHGPRAGGATFLAQFSTKSGVNTQLITSTIGPIELWSFNTTASDVRIRNALYEKIGAAESRKILAMLYPSGSAAKIVEDRQNRIKESTGMITDDESENVIESLINEILEVYKNNPQLAHN